jgi:NADPH-dependent 2,4-dienoyl-CoA reductase/sulfur reductase-like enzyme
MKLVIIGAVAAGMSAASKLKRLDPSINITVYEKGKDVSYGACGMPYYVSGEIEDDQTLVARTPEQFRKKGIDLHLKHEVTHVDPQNKEITVRGLENDTKFSATYDKLLIGTGATEIRLPIEGSDLEGILTLGTLEDARAMHGIVRDERIQKIAIIGAGYIGVEISESLRKLGKDVRIIEQMPQVLPKFSEMVGEVVGQNLRENGVSLHLEERLEKYTGKDRVETLHTDKGVYEVDLVIEAIGVKPATAFLAKSGIDMLDNGAIKVNEKMETNIEDIYAAGDCAAYPHKLTGEMAYIPLGTHANKAGRVIAERISGLDSVFHGVIGSSVLKAFELEVARTGVTTEEAKQFDSDTVTITAPDRSGYYPGATPIDIQVTYDKKTCRLLGVEMVGEAGVAHRINVAATAISSGLTAHEFSQLDLAYAPPFSPVWDPLQTACNQIKCKDK